jgi:hypothetical protein
MGGFIGIDRGLRDHWIYQDAEYLKVWLEMLFLARFSEETHTELIDGDLISVEYGQFIFGRVKWSQRLKISEQRLRTLMVKLKKENMIELVLEHRKCSVYALVNYAKFNHESNHQKTQSQQWFEDDANHQINQLPTISQPSANHQPTTKEQCSNKVNKDNNVQEDIKIIGANAPKRTKFIAPSLEEVSSYCNERGTLVDPVKWYDYYTSNGWRVGKNPMKDWKAAVRTWERANIPQTNVKQFQPRSRQGTSGKVITPGITDRSGKSLSEDEMEAIIRKAERWEEKRPSI